MILTCLWSCSEINTNQCKASGDFKYSLVKQNQNVVFDLDSLSSPNIRYSEFFKTDDQLYFTFLNPFNNVVYFYDYATKGLIKKTHLDSEKKLAGYSILRLNRIMSYEYWNEVISLHDSSGTVLKQLNVPSVEDAYYALPSNRSPIKIVDESVYLVSVRSA